jgi:hypothetical protein
VSKIGVQNWCPKLVKKVRKNIVLFSKIKMLNSEVNDNIHNYRIRGILKIIPSYLYRPTTMMSIGSILSGNYPAKNNSFISWTSLLLGVYITHPWVYDLPTKCKVGPHVGQCPKLAQPHREMQLCEFPLPFGELWQTMASSPL